MESKNNKAVVIGGGIHGLTAAIFLASNGFDVILLEKRDNIMRGTSGSTHNRAHMGYHYPRSMETAVECLEGLNFFKKRYSAALYYPKESYYLLEKNNSKTSFEEFKSFCDQIGIPYEVEFSGGDKWNEKNIKCGFKVPEPVFNMSVLSEMLSSEAKSLGVKIITRTEVKDMKREGEFYYIVARDPSGQLEFPANIIVNATYALVNNTLKALGIADDMVEYELQKTEVVTARSKVSLPALTVMDGPFVSIMPLAEDRGENLFLIYDVANSVVERQDGFLAEDVTPQVSNFSKMIEHGRQYFPFMDDLEYVCSQYGLRPIPKMTIGDSRKTRIVAHKKYPGIYSIFEGKCISAPLIAQKLVEMIKQDNRII